MVLSASRVHSLLPRSSNRSVRKFLLSLFQFVFPYVIRFLPPNSTIEVHLLICKLTVPCRKGQQLSWAILFALVWRQIWLLESTPEWCLLLTKQGNRTMSWFLVKEENVSMMWSESTSIWYSLIALTSLYSWLETMVCFWHWLRELSSPSGVVSHNVLYPRPRPARDHHEAYATLRHSTLSSRQSSGQHNARKRRLGIWACILRRLTW